jgi:hypothetical protein
MLEEIRQQPAALARTIAAEARHIEKFKQTSPAAGPS